MKILIVEDEKPAARHLSELILQVRPQAELLDVIDTVKDAINWFRNFPPPDLLFVDIQLADGLSFDIFEHLPTHPPTIFTTAYDHYTLQAFKLNSIDYLLKPIDQEELARALQKFEQFNQVFSLQAIRELAAGRHQEQYKERFLIRSGQQLIYLPVASVRYFLAKDGLVRLYQQDGKKHMLDYTLDQLETLLDPLQFFRINRQLIVGIEAIRNIHLYFNSRLKLELSPPLEEEVIVSRDRVPQFKAWLDR